MAGKKRFSSSLLGFKKSDVNDYLEKIIREFDSRLSEKDKEISNLKELYRDVKTRYEILSKNTEGISQDKEKIAEALLSAQDKAKMLLNVAEQKALEEKKRLESLLEQEREKIVDVKSELKLLKHQVIRVLNNFVDEINDLSTEDEATNNNENDFSNNMTNEVQSEIDSSINTFENTYDNNNQDNNDIIQNDYYYSRNEVAFTQEGDNY